MTCPSTRLPVSTGHRAPAVDLPGLVGDRAFRCQCGAVHRWDAQSAWVEDRGSLDQELATEMAALDGFLGRPEPGDTTVIVLADVRSQRAREARAKRQDGAKPW
jgi:hypothetical protein